MRTIGVLGTVVAAALLFAAAGSSGSGPRTIVTEPGPIRAFAQDGGRTGWTVYRPKARCFSAVVNADLNGRRRQPMTPGKGRTCHDETGFQFATGSRFALAGKEALWVLSESGNDVYDHVVHGVAGRPDREIRLFQYSAASYDGDRLGELAGAGRTLVYGWYRVVITDDSCFEGGECRWEVTDGSVRRIVNRRPVPVSGAPAALRVATNGPRVALVTAHGEATRFGVPLDRRNVEVRDVTSGQLLSSFRTGRNVLDLALGDDVVAVLMGGPMRVARFDARSGKVLGSTPVPRETVSIQASGSLLALAGGWWRIHLLDLATGQLRSVAATRIKPIGLSVAGNRVTWAENRRGRGVVRSLTLP